MYTNLKEKWGASILLVLYSYRVCEKVFHLRFEVTLSQKKNLNLRIKSEPVTDGADATVNAFLLLTYIVTFTATSAPAVTGSIFMRLWWLSGRAPGYKSCGPQVKSPAFPTVP